MDSGFRRFFLEEYDGMLRLAYSLVGRAEDAEDAVQSAFMDVVRHQASIRRPGAYLRTAVINHCRTILRRREMVGRARPRPPADLGSEVEELWECSISCPRGPARRLSCDTTPTSHRPTSVESSTAPL